MEQSEPEPQPKLAEDHLAHRGQRRHQPEKQAGGEVAHAGPGHHPSKKKIILENNKKRHTHRVWQIASSPETSSPPFSAISTVKTSSTTCSQAQKGNSSSNDEHLGS